MAGFHGNSRTEYKIVSSFESSLERKKVDEFIIFMFKVDSISLEWYKFKYCML